MSTSLPPSVEVRTYRKSDSVVFHRTRDTFGGLSNMAAGFPVRVNGIVIQTVEALYQACRFPGHPEVQQRIVGQYSPMSAKDISRENSSFTRADWLSVRAIVMRWCLRVKLAQNFDKFSALLISTGSANIVEYSTRDSYWGAKPALGDELIGANVLGRLLMELRELLKFDIDGKLLSVGCPPIHDFLLLGQEVHLVSSHERVISVQERQSTLNI